MMRWSTPRSQQPPTKTENLVPAPKASDLFPTGDIRNLSLSSFGVQCDSPYLPELLRALQSS
jgi:hypothetical protein